MLSFAISEWNYRNTFIDAIVFEFLFLPIRMIAVYINWLVFIPKFLYTNKHTHYATAIIVLLSVLAITQRVFVLYYGYPQFFPEWTVGQHIHVFKFTSLVQVALIIATPLAITTGWKLFVDLKEKEQFTKVLEKEKTDSELKYLKSQINPHFLFNTLNNIYGLSLENSKKTSGLILKLSDFLSFSLYESNQKLIPLEKEIALMNDFIALEKSRFEDRVKVVLKLSKNKTSDILIPPLILVPFVENAFKHSLKNETEMATIHIHLSVSEKNLNFAVTNSKPLDSGILSKNKGLGLINIKKRLAIIYEDNYSLHINEQPDSYTIKLHIKTA